METNKLNEELIETGAEESTEAASNGNFKACGFLVWYRHSCGRVACFCKDCET